ncbi:MAG: hypothetical protein KKE73_09330 [Proteobacteria bacterium]|nr:hypothetical protein [Pseudomonadota bacterium]
MKHPTLPLVATLLLALLWVAPACATGPALHTDHEDQARAAVQELLNAYAGGSRAGFAHLVSQDFSPQRQDYLNRMDQAARSEQAVQFEFFVEQVLIKDQTMTVTVRWNKKAQTAAGQTKTDGLTVFVFGAENGLWKLTQTRGDNPF